MPRYRIRQCPRCLRQFPAGDLEMYDLGSFWTDGWATRACPYCHREGSTKSFTLITDLPNKKTFERWKEENANT